LAAWEPTTNIGANALAATRPSAHATTTHAVAFDASSSADRFDEQALVESARSSADAFAELYRRYVERIYSFALRRSHSNAIAEDVTSATFEKALRNLHRYRWKEPGIGPWLFRIASNELVNVYRSDQRQVAIAATLSDQPDRAVELVAQSFAGDPEILDALAKIRPRYQRAISLRYFADLTNEEAAAAMGVARGTMPVIVHRALKALRKALADHEAGDDRD